MDEENLSAIAPRITTNPPSAGLVHAHSNRTDSHAPDAVENSAQELRVIYSGVYIMASRWGLSRTTW
ncbi:hypothetical protein Cob_v007881 [Colletotrichum orbiculare MAFF 240422]|uniref:Uncharacterized protein n=1 Tax=Colletotrichum orbiculare (strain 104-T / ATCC 96160 / CBS 514.97 / LARS 414 / MAFF 240422) TaxID=1213857 RepID=A0A484FRA3_COLOR|nr:hypothetical protein Cob_v007881 [Colletotrichum orbiculare MAFF 240422]